MKWASDPWLRPGMGILAILLGWLVAAGVWGCSALTQGPQNMAPHQQAISEAIMDTRTGRQISFPQLIERLNRVRVVYIGEQHTNVRHHEIQLKIIRALAESRANIIIGMEMFDHSYQPKLDRWTAGQMTWDAFLKQVHWFANWKYPPELYKEILEYIQSRRLKLVGLNIPFHLPPKIAIGGIDSLSPAERSQLPQQIDTTQTAHRAYLEEIYNAHHFPGKSDFESFYEAQCAWEDGMAQAVADLGEQEMIVVLAGNGHIVRKFGIPERAHKRLPLPYRTVYLATHEMTVTAADGDFIWTANSQTSQTGNPHQ